MSDMSAKVLCVVLVALLGAFGAKLAPAQQILPPEAVPPSFTEDARFAGRTRSRLLPYTEPASGQYVIGKQVMETLLRQLPVQRAKFSWELRIAKGTGNVFASPDGAIFVDEEIAQLLGSRAGLWAATLSHEISHIVRRDWARRYLFEKSLEQAEAPQLSLGEAGGFSGTWVEGQVSSSRLAVFCQSMELEADAEGLMLMTRAGFDPDFVPALHHLMEGQPGPREDSSHPAWDVREQRLRKVFIGAGLEYDRLWPERYASPGGNSPIVVYAGSPSGKRNATGELEVLVPLQCQNLAGSIEVVLRLTDTKSGAPAELRQVTGCTSNPTLIAFMLPAPEGHRRGHVQADISVLDNTGGILTHTLSPIPVR